MQMFLMSKHLQMSVRFEDILGGIISNMYDEDKLDFFGSGSVTSNFWNTRKETSRIP